MSDLFAKMSFINAKLANRAGKSSIKVSSTKGSIWDDVGQVLQEKEKKGFIVPRSDTFSRNKRMKSDSEFGVQMTGLATAVQSCASIFKSNLLQHKQIISSEGHMEYKDSISMLFDPVKDESKREEMMKMMLRAINEFTK